jgi:hypothetical protein
MSDIIVHVLPHKISDSASSVGCLECNFMDFKKTTNAKSIIPVLVSEQTLSHALADNSSSYTLL